MIDLPRVWSGRSETFTVPRWRVLLRFGLAAALGVLSARGVSPFEGAAAWFRIEGPGELSAEEHRAADAWLAAEEVAALVCFGACAAEVHVVLELCTGPDGELWVGRRPSGLWAPVARGGRGRQCGGGQGHRC